MEARYPENPHSVEGGENHEKKTVLQRAKDKANKIKSSMMSKMTRGHHADGDHEHDHDNDVVSEEGEVYEEAEEEREAAPEVNGAPMYESEAARQFTGGRDENLGPGKAMATTTVEDPSRPKEKRFGTTAASDESQLSYPSTDTDGERPNLIRDLDENIDPQTITSRATAGSVEEDLSASKAMTGTPAAATQQGHPSDPYPKGGDEVGESPLLSSFQEMAVSDKPKGTEGVFESPPTRSHVRGEPDKPLQDALKEGTEEQMSSSYTEKISSTATAAKDAAVSGAIGSAKPKDAEGVLESPLTGSHDQFSPDIPQQDTPKEGTEEQMSSSYTDKISSTATAAKDAAVSGAIGSAKPKDAEGVLESPPAGSHDQFSPDIPQQDTPKEGAEEQMSSSYTDKISSTATAAKDAAVSGAIGTAKPKDTEGVLESPPAGSHDQFSPDKPQQDTPKEGTEEQMSSSYTDKISSTATAAKDAAVSGAIGSAKPKDAEGVLESPPAGSHDQFSPDKPQQDTSKEETEEQKSSSYTDKISSTATAAKDVAVSGAIGSAVYGKKIASTVYGKVSEAGTAIMGKGMNQEEKNDDIKTRQPVNGVSDKDKGVSVKDYIIGKLRPGDEDKALSEVISDAMHTKKQEAVGGAPEGVRGPEQGLSEENGESGSGKGMVEKIKGAVTSWIGAGSTAASARDSPTTMTMADPESKGKEA